MDITISNIQDQIGFAYDYVCAKAGAFAGHVVTVYDQGLTLVRQDSRAAAGATFAANIAIFELAIRITTLVDEKIFPRIFADEGNRVRGLLLLGVFSSIMIGLNVALAKGLQTKLKTVTIVAISIGAIACDMIFRNVMQKIMKRGK